MKINDEKLNHLRFADDMVLIAGSKQKLEDMVTEFAERSEKVGLRLHTSKTKILAKSGKKDGIKLKEEGIEKVEQID